ncbi:MAG: CheR family methyltransferase [Prochlorotrichaceae cyanobacterium]|jgi:chemotaxis protein methyltransferase CheR
MVQDTLKKIAHLITLYAGIKIRDQDYEQFTGKIRARMKVLNLSSLEEYYQLLLKATQMKNVFLGYQSTPSLQPHEQEWQNLLTSITITETYFLRDFNQFRILKEYVLPEIIDRKQREARLGTLPTLRIWSAGCSTGEELYSIAILLKELKFPWDKWNILLLGTDINETALEVARKGTYTNWSFRQVSPDLQRQYFRHRFQTWLIDPSLKSKVTFQYANLLHDDFPTAHNNLYNFDLIVCRNVFIYFEFQAIAHVLQKFYESLNPLGYLMTGHTELHGQNLKIFALRNFADSMIYQRPDPSSTVLGFQTDSPPLSAPRKLVEPVSIQTVSDGAPVSDVLHSLNVQLLNLKKLLNSENYRAVLETSYQLIQKYPNCCELFILAGEAHANLGEYQKAKASCWRALEIQEFSISAYLLLAHIAEEEGDLVETKKLLKKVIYLDPNSVPAYLYLASIYAREKDMDKSKKMNALALSILQKLPDELKKSQSYMGSSWSDLEEHLLVIS